MRTKLKTTFRVVVLALAIMAGNNHTAFSQCENPFLYGTVTAPTNSAPLLIASCMYYDEYNTINNAVTGRTYKFTATPTSFLTVRQGTPGGTVLGTGTGSVTITATANGSLYLHVNTDSDCGFETAICVDTYVQCTSCPTPYNGTVVTSLPFSASAGCNSNNEINGATIEATCSGMSTSYLGGLEAVYIFAPTETKEYTISYQGQTWNGIYVFEGDPTQAGTYCMGYSTVSASSNILSVELYLGITYFIVIDTWPSPASPCPGEVSIYETPACDYLVPETGFPTIIADSGYLCDAGGLGNYPNNCDGSLIILPVNDGDLVQLDFVEFQVENNWDMLYIYDGVGIETLIGEYTGANAPTTVTSTTGPLTVRFTSDGSVVQSGFSAEISNIPNLSTNTFSLSGLTMYPNPANETVTVSNPYGIDIAEVNAYDLNGRLVHTTVLRDTAGDMSLNISTFASGVYLFRVTAQDGQVETFKIIKK